MKPGDIVLALVVISVWGVAIIVLRGPDIVAAEIALNLP